MKKIDGKSMDVVANNIAKLKEIFPEVFCEDKVDFERLQEVLGSYVEDKEERYRFEWNGKSKAIRMSQTPSTGTLRPCKEESKDWDRTQNLYIEGDNLEVLKLLQKSYQNKVKMIYIDPPYNTGKDFVYKDDFKDNIKNYLEITGQLDNEGNKISTNPDTSGRYHTDWLNMMYPRLRLAKNLLSEDGVIFISIDDNEVSNLKYLCDEIFGENNFISCFTWIKKKKGSHLSKTVRSMTEYVLCYSKNISKIELFGEEAYSDKWQPLAKRTNAYKTLEFYENVIETKLKDGEYKAGNYGEGTSSLEFLNNFIVSNGIVKSSLKVKGPFVWTQNKLDDELKLGSMISLSSKFGFNTLRSNQDEKVKRPTTILDSKLNIGTNEDAYAESINIFALEGVMSYPKPASLIKYLINTMSYYNKEMIILDFFSGSATTAQASIELNFEKNINLRYIMIQIPEIIKNDTPAYRIGLRNVCEIGKERIRRAGEKIKEDNKEKEGIENLDIGFKVFKLDSSNIKKYNFDYCDESEEYNEQLEGYQINFNYNEKHIENFVPNRTEEDVVYEIMLKYGIDLTYPVDERVINDKKLYIIGFGALMICLDSNITKDISEGIIKLKDELKPEICRVVFKDNGFKDNQDKINICKTLKKHNIDEVMSI